MSDTPRTDKVMEECGELHGVLTMYGYMTEHAKQIERELSTLQKLADIDRIAHAGLDKENERLERELADLRKRFDIEEEESALDYACAVQEDAFYRRRDKSK